VCLGALAAWLASRMSGLVMVHEYKVCELEVDNGLCTSLSRSGEALEIISRGRQPEKRSDSDGSDPGVRDTVIVSGSEIDVDGALHATSARLCSLVALTWISIRPCFILFCMGMLSSCRLLRHEDEWCFRKSQINTTTAIAAKTPPAQLTPTIVPSNGRCPGDAEEAG